MPIRWLDRGKNNAIENQKSKSSVQISVLFNIKSQYRRSVDKQIGFLYT